MNQRDTALVSKVSKSKRLNKLSKSPSSKHCLNHEGSPVHSKKSVSPKDWSFRYKQLQEQYKQILQQTKNNRHIQQMQERQLTKLRADKERDQKEIYRLRSMLGFLESNKSEIGVQVNMEMQSTSSWTTKYQKSTDHGLQMSRTTNSQFPNKSREKRKSNSKRNSPKIERSLLESRKQMSPKHKLHIKQFQQELFLQKCTSANNLKNIKQINKTSYNHNNKFSNVADSNSKFLKDLNKNQVDTFRLRTESLMQDTEREKLKIQEPAYSGSPKYSRYRDRMYNYNRENQQRNEDQKLLSNSPYAKFRFLRKKEIYQ